MKNIAEPHSYISGEIVNFIDNTKASNKIRKVKILEKKEFFATNTIVIQYRDLKVPIVREAVFSSDFVGSSDLLAVKELYHLN
jgi:hypothetical protein